MMHMYEDNHMLLVGENGTRLMDEGEGGGEGIARLGQGAIDDDGEVEVKCLKKQPIIFGRVYARECISAISLRRELRGTIFTKNYVIRTR